MKPRIDRKPIPSDASPKFQEFVDDLHKLKFIEMFWKWDISKRKLTEYRKEYGLAVELKYYNGKRVAISEGSKKEKELRAMHRRNEKLLQEWAPKEVMEFIRENEDEIMLGGVVVRHTDKPTKPLSRRARQRARRAGRARLMGFVSSSGDWV